MKYGIGNKEAVKQTYVLAKDPDMSAAKDGKIRNGDIILAVNRRNVADLKEATRLIEDCSLSENSTLGMLRTTPTTFHKEMPVDKDHAGRYQVAIDSQWQMSFVMKKLESTNDQTTTEGKWTKIFFVTDIEDTDPAWHCGVRHGDILLDVNGHDVREMNLNNVSEKIREAKDADSSILLMSRVRTPDAASFISELGNSDEKSDDEDEKKEDNLTLSEYNAKQKKRRNEDREAGGMTVMTMALMTKPLRCTLLASETSKFFILKTGF